MSDATAAGAAGPEETSGPLVTADGRPLKAALARAERLAKRRAFLLVAPLFLFIIVTFVVPIGQILWQSVYNPDFPENMPRLTQWFEHNPQGTEPNEAAYKALVLDLADAKKDFAQGKVGTRVNYEMSGTRSLFTKTARHAEDIKPPYKEAVLKIDKDWANPDLWETMRQVSGAVTENFYLAAIDKTHNKQGQIVNVPPDRQIYVSLFVKTFLLSGLITFLCFLLGFPVAHLLAVLPLRLSNLLMIFVLLPFWTSLLVRTTSWMVLLQREGVINDFLVNLGLVGNDHRLQMMYNSTGTVVAMTHILLPFMILPLYSVMRPIPPSYVRAARSLGATSWTAFRRIYFPQTVPGIGAGALLVFILSVGYYITPALVGGASGQLISNLIAYHITKSLNWSLGAALAAILLAAVLLLYWLYDKIIGIDNLKLG